VLDQFEKTDLLKRAENTGKTVSEKFNQFYEHYLVVGDIRGPGAMVGMELVVDRKTKEPATALQRNWLIAV
jgi:4-aminobutyrate aminotransferase/(S)-3-amino-2-methylpropionate transaminase